VFECSLSLSPLSSRRVSSLSSLSPLIECPLSPLSLSPLSSVLSLSSLSRSTPPRLQREQQRRTRTAKSPVRTPRPRTEFRSRHQDLEQRSGQDTKNPNSVPVRKPRPRSGQDTKTSSPAEPRRCTRELVLASKAASKGAVRVHSTLRGKESRPARRSAASPPRAQREEERETEKGRETERGALGERRRERLREAPLERGGERD
jgi:hypothetical protein